MNTTGSAFFQQFLDDYFAESEEHLTSARRMMLAIESSGPNKLVDSKLFDELLRNFHSLKGLSAMVGMEEATQLSHHIEDYLKELKQQSAVISSEGIENVLGGITAIEQVLAAKRKSEALPDVSAVLLHLDAAVEALRTNSLPSAKPRTEGIWRFVFRPSSDLARRGFTVNTVRDKLRKIGQVVKASPQVLSDGQVEFEFVVRAAIPESAFEDLSTYGIEYSRGAEDSIKAEQDKSDRPPDPQTAKITPLNVVRVDMHRLDDLMRVVGELVISRYRLDELLRVGMFSSNDNSALQEINSSMERQLRELRETVVHIRMVPVGQLFERMRFVVRGLARDLNKRVEVHTEGENTEIDKVIVERMMDPLLHLVRNAVSHGLESSEERLMAGKPESGIVRLTATTVGDTFTLEVEDDGRGIDVNKVVTRAQNSGWVLNDELLDSKQLLDIISAPGLTTREEADFASGRGVGMAAVQTAVNELGGTMTLTTTQGRGTRFTLHLPLTLLIADSLMVTVGQQRFAIPQTAIREVFAVESSTIKAFDNNEVIPFRNSVLPILRLARLFGVEDTKRSKLHVLVVAGADSPTALAVDRITGQREIVVRTLSDPLLRVPGVVGATELGDGRPVLIVDPHSLIRAAGKHKNKDIAS
jgi:two-component system, chemotaxis family, sensor kinase CheA